MKKRDKIMNGFKEIKKGHYRSMNEAVELLIYCAILGEAGSYWELWGDYTLVKQNNDWMVEHRKLGLMPISKEILNEMVDMFIEDLQDTDLDDEDE